MFLPNYIEKFYSFTELYTKIVDKKFYFKRSRLMSKSLDLKLRKNLNSELNDDILKNIKIYNRL